MHTLTVSLKLYFSSYLANIAMSYHSAAYTEFRITISCLDTHQSRRYAEFPLKVIDLSMTIHILVDDIDDIPYLHDTWYLDCPVKSLVTFKITNDISVIINTQDGKSILGL